MAILSFLELVKKYQEIPEEIESCDCFNCIYSRNLEYEEECTGKIKYEGLFCFREGLSGKECMKYAGVYIPGYVKKSYIGKDFCGQGYFFDESEEV